ncbi:MAG TPA: ferritin-like domain-containing protein [Ktedonobacteraceae bacterium]|nr:ferritin-like domain-containing protein [Ktedonobacteraceae bacterium]
MERPDDLTPETDDLMESFSTRRTRRSLLKGAAAGVAGAAGLSAAGAGVFSLLHGSANIVHAKALAGSSCVDSIKTIFTVARTAERLAVTFYTNGMNNANELGITGDNLDIIQAALIEEQIHELFFAANGGGVLASTFSFPHGPDTFTDLNLFIATQQQLEGVFDSAFLVAIREFAQLGRPDLAEIAGQIATVEAEHRALGRMIGGLEPADNWVFSPVLLPSVGAAPALVKKAGYLSPKPGNSYTYKQVGTHITGGVIYRQPYAVSCS